jgi:hypothetical protein
MTKKRDAFDFWYAVNNTEIRVMPKHHLETFGTTTLRYHLVAEMMDTANQTRVREGRMLASRPQIITPEAYSQTVLDGFGDEARQYVDWLRTHEKEIRILQYGYTLRKELYNEHIVSESPKTVLDRVEKEVRDLSDPFCAVVMGVDDPWDVCLVKLFWEVIQSSATANLRELEKRRMFDDVGGVPRAVREEIEADFLAASRNAALIKPLAKKLQGYRLFDEYQDRFFALIRASKRQG